MILQKHSGVSLTLRPTRIVKLTQNFRSHPSILSYPNRLFYKGELEVYGDPAIINSLGRFDRLASPTFPVIFHSISGKLAACYQYFASPSNISG